MPGTLVVVRHAESTWNAEHRWAGQADPPLTARGVGQARALGLRLVHSPARPGRVVTSDLRRAADTGRVAGAVLGLVPQRPDAGLRERRVSWSGRTSDEIEADHPGQLDAWRRGALPELPGASEPWPAFVARVLAALHHHARRHGTTLVVAHAGVFRVLERVCGTPHRRHGNGEGVALRLVAGVLSPDRATTAG
jgi:broad specificity phosphatase PhoE